MPFVSQAQQRFAFGTGQPWAKRWARETNFSKLPKRKRRKVRLKATFTLDQLEAFVCSEHYDPDTAALIAAGVPALPRLKGEQIAPGITRIRGNLCNVHGRYGKCPGAPATPASAGKKPKKPRAARAKKPKQTPEQRAQARQQEQQANADTVARQMAENDTGLSPSGSKALLAFAGGTPPDAATGEGLAKMGLAERAEDGSYRMTPTGRAVVAAMRAGDYQRAVDAISRGGDTAARRGERQAARTTRQAAAAQRRAAAEAKRQAAQQKKPAKAGGGGGGKKPEKAPAKASTPPRRVPSAGSGPTGATGASSSTPEKPKPKPTEPKPEKQEAPAVAPALAATAQRLSDGAELSEQETQTLIRNGMARLDKNDNLILTAAGQRAIRKKSIGELGRSQLYASAVHTTTQDIRDGIRATSALSTMRLIDRRQDVSVSISPSFRIFKDARGAWRWVAQSSTAFQDRDREIVSTKALAEDCEIADATGQYGPLRWWHVPGLDLGDCDFNAMHGRVLIESGTFRSAAIAQKVARAAGGLEISLGFLHLPTEPDADGVFHHIRKFERSLVPRGKASNRFTAFTVKEIPGMDEKKIAGLKALGFSDTEITLLQSQAAATEKAADDQQVAYKADEPATESAPEPQEITIAGVTYQIVEKAAPPPPMAEEEAAAVEVETDAVGEMPMEAEESDGGLTLSEEDITAIGQAVAAALSQALGPLVSAMDMTNKMGAHMAELKTMLGAYQTQKDSSDADAKQQIAALTETVKAQGAQLSDLIGDQPAVPYRASQSQPVNPFIPQDQALIAAVKDQVAGDPFNNGQFDDLIQKLVG